MDDDEIVIDSVNANELDNVLDSGDVEAIEALLNDEPEKTEAEENQETEKKPESSNAEDQEKETEQNSNAETSEKQDETSAASGAEEEDAKFVTSKDGKHTIPYEVLENARSRARDAGQKVEEFQTKAERAQTELEEAKRENDALKQQLQRNSIEPEKPLDQIELDPESLEEWGSAGKVLQALYAQNQAMASQMQEIKQAQVIPTQDESPVDRAVRENADLSSWANTDVDRWETALSVDSKLQSDPVWQDKPIPERFAEVVRRTKAVFGEFESKSNSSATAANIQAQAKAKLEEAANNQIPQSLTDIGKTPEAEKTKLQLYEGMDVADVAADMENLSDAQLEELLADLG